MATNRGERLVPLKIQSDFVINVEQKDLNDRWVGRDSSLKLNATWFVFCSWFLFVYLPLLFMIMSITTSNFFLSFINDYVTAVTMLLLFFIIITTIMIITIIMIIIILLEILFSFLLHFFSELDENSNHHHHRCSHRCHNNHYLDPQQTSVKLTPAPSAIPCSSSMYCGNT